MADTEALAQIHEMVALPEGSLVSSGVVVVSYLDAEGDEKWGMRVVSDESYSKLTGLLGMASHELFHHANPTPCEVDPDDDDA